MAYISKRDGTGRSDQELIKTTQNESPKPSKNIDNDEYDDDLDGEDELDEDEDFKEDLDTEFPLSGGETDGDA
jgi:hypothetical protein